MTFPGHFFHSFDTDGIPDLFIFPTQPRLFYARSRDPGPTVAKSRWQKHGGWEVFEAEGVCPVYCGPNAREDALSYARQRAGYAPTEIRVLDAAVERG